MDIKIFDITKSVILIGVVLYGVYIGRSFVNSFIETNTNLQTQIIKIADNAISVSNKNSNKEDFEKLKKQIEEENKKLLDKVEEQKRKTGEAIDEIGKVKSEIKQTRELNTASTKVYDKEGQDINHYFYKEITIKNKDEKDAKVAWVLFYPNRPDNQKWKTGTFPMSVDTTVVETQNKNGSYNRYAEVDVKDKNKNDIPVTLNEIKWEKIPLKEKRFFWMNPRIALSTSIYTSINVGLNVSLASYGRTEVDMDYRFLTLGANVNESDSNTTFMFNFEPVSWNVGKIIPLIDNLFIGPYVSYDFKQDPWSGGIQFSIPF